jgi:hypothetical protein
MAAAETLPEGVMRACGGVGRDGAAGALFMAGCRRAVEGKRGGGAAASDSCSSPARARGRGRHGAADARARMAATRERRAAAIRSGGPRRAGLGPIAQPDEKAERPRREGNAAGPKEKRRARENWASGPKLRKKFLFFLFLF